MPLRGPRFSGDPVLEECFAGRHRMLAPEQGLPVKRVQAALIELGGSVGPKVDDGIFGSDTGVAVSAYKASKDPLLTPTDPVVGPGTSKALDDDLFLTPRRLIRPSASSPLSWSPIASSRSSTVSWRR